MNPKIKCSIKMEAIVRSVIRPQDSEGYVHVKARCNYATVEFPWLAFAAPEKGDALRLTVEWGGGE